MKNNLLLGLLFVILLFSFFVRIYRLGEPPRYNFDEVYHVVTARAYAQNNPAAYDPFAPAPEKGTAFEWLHPPLAKLVQAASIKIVGDNPVGWRLPSAVLGTLLVAATFALAYLLVGRAGAVFSSAVIALENMNLVMSRITMNDIFVTFFVVCSFIFAYLYHRTDKIKHLLLTGLFLGLAISSKWSGFYAVLAIFLFIAFDKLKKKHFDFKVLFLVLLPLFIYLLSYGQFWLQGHSIKQFVDLNKQIWWYQNRHDLEHPYGTTPLFCVPKGLEGPKTWCPWALDTRGVYFSYEQYGNKSGFIYALGNPLVFWSGILAISFIIGKYIETKRKEFALILLGYFVFWLPWIVSPRILFLHHYLPSIPFMAISLGYVLSLIWHSKFKYLSLVIVGIFAAAFFYFYPISAGYPIDTASVDKYMWLKTWR